MSPEKGAFLRGQTNVMCQIGSTPLNRGKNRKYLKPPGNQFFKEEHGLTLKTMMIYLSKGDTN